MRDPTLLDVFAAFVAHAGIVSGKLNMTAIDVYDMAEALLVESEVRHGHRPE